MVNCCVEIMVHVLSRLPPKSLVRFKCVHKSWSALINNSSFVAKHLRMYNQLSSSIPIFLKRSVKTRTETSNEKILFSFLNLPKDNVDDDDLNSIVEEFHFPSSIGILGGGPAIELQHGEPADILGHCEGIICLVIHTGDLVLCNPATKEFKVVPESCLQDTTSEIAGFGYDPKSNDFKIGNIGGQLKKQRESVRGKTERERRSLSGGVPPRRRRTGRTSPVRVRNKPGFSSVFLWHVGRSWVVACRRWWGEEDAAVEFREAHRGWDARLRLRVRGLVLMLVRLWSVLVAQIWVRSVGSGVRSGRLGMDCGDLWRDGAACLVGGAVWGGSGDVGGASPTAVGGAGFGRARATGNPVLPPPVFAWVWAHCLGQAWVKLLFSFCRCVFHLVVVSVFGSACWISNKSLLSRVKVVGVGPCACGCTQCALSALGRRRVSCFVKWSLPPSGRVKLSVVGCSIRRQHGWKAEVYLDVRLCKRVTHDCAFQTCHRLFEANRVAINGVLFASWCIVVCKCVVEFPVIITGLCNQGFRFYVPPCIRQFH